MKQKRRVHSVGAPRFPSTSQETIENDQAVPTGVRELKLLDYKYDESRDIVLWKVEDFTPGNSPEMRVYALAFPSSDIGRQYGFSEHLPKKAIIAFCETVKNRTETFKNAYFTTAKRADAEWSKILSISV